MARPNIFRYCSALIGVICRSAQWSWTTSASRSKSRILEDWQYGIQFQLYLQELSQQINFQETQAQ